jgi:Cdc6-like AAA superfamily ATPase|nr:BREX system ATP-binding domain-containing protein [uncultured Sphaerochaeta sp.]
MSWEYEQRHMIEALRSGIPSKAIGHHFSEARKELLSDLISRLDAVSSEGISDGMIISGKYGEGKTHLLNTVYTLAHARNMVVSVVSLSKETPLDKLYLVYPKLISNTFLPGRLQPGFTQELDKLTPNAPLANDLLLYAATQLETDRLYYLLRSYLHTDDQEEQFQLQTDLEGDFVSNVQIRKMYRRIFAEKANFNQNFVKSRHTQDYLAFLSHLFVQLGYQGWVILFDESELVGRLSKKARAKAYQNLARFLFPPKMMESTFSLFAFSASYTEDVIEAKHEYQNLEELYPEDQMPMKAVLDAILKAPQLKPLTHEEIRNILLKMVQFHAQAYDWVPSVDTEKLLQQVDRSGYLLRSKIRTAIEYLDQLYLYQSEETSTVRSLEREQYEEEAVESTPTFEELFEGEE